MRGISDHCVRDCQRQNRDSQQENFEIDFMSGEAVQSFVAGAGSLTPEQRARIRKILMP